LAQLWILTTSDSTNSSHIILIMSMMGTKVQLCDIFQHSNTKENFLWKQVCSWNHATLEPFDGWNNNLPRDGFLTLKRFMKHTHSRISINLHFVLQKWPKGWGDISTKGLCEIFWKFCVTKWNLAPSVRRWL